MKRSYVSSLLVLLSIVSLGGKLYAAEPIRVFVAASIGSTVKSLAEVYEKKHHVKINLNVASSGKLARQIEMGAPADIYISASQKWMDYGKERNLLIAKTCQPFMTNSLVLIVPKNSKVDKVKTDELVPVLVAMNGRLAIGDPSHVPAGAYAREALNYYKCYAKLAGKLNPAVNVNAALRLVEMGECPFGIVYKTVAAKSTKVKVVMDFPLNSHRPISYGIGMTPFHQESAAGFYAYLRNAMIKKTTTED